MISDDDIDGIFDEFLNQPELASWESDLSWRERQEARRLFREAVRKAIEIDCR